MINATLQSKFEDSKLMNMSLVEVTVELSNSSLMTTMASKLLAELRRVAPYAGYSPVEDLTEQDIERYLSTLMWMRVCNVLESRDKSWSAYKPIRNTVAVPVLMYQLLLCVGIAYDKDYNLEFLPAYKITQENLLSVAEMDKLSSIFRQFEDAGIKVVYGIPKDPRGELDFMAMSHVQEEVLSYKKSHPVYGFLAAFFRQQQLNETTGNLCRIIYGYESDYKYQIDALFNAIDG